MKNSYSLVKIYLTFLFMFISIGQLLSNEYYASNSAQISSLQSSLFPGDTLVLTNGVWYNQIVKLSVSGTELDTIVVKAETPGHVIFTGKSLFNISGKYIKVDGLRFEGTKSSDDEVFGFRVGSSKAYNCRLTNSSIVNYNPPSKGIGYKWVSIYGKNNRVDHCYFKGKNHDGALLVVWMPDSREEVFHKIDHNYFRERPELGFNGGETIRIGTSQYSMSDASCTVEYNYFEKCDGEVEIISNKTGNNLYRGNTFVECKGSLTLRHGNGSTVTGNYFFGNRQDSTGGIRIIGEDHLVYNNYLQGLYGEGFYGALTIMNGVPNSPLNRYFQVNNVFVGFNTLVDCKSGIQLGFGSDAERSLPPINSTIANNIISSPGFAAVTLIDTPESFLYEGNIFWADSLGMASNGGINFIDPLLSEGVDSLWRITDSSPAYNAALGDYPMVNNDMDSQPRDSNKDVGADEVSINPILTKPLKPSDVGPIWFGSNVPVNVSVSFNGRGSVEFNPVGGAYEIGTVIEITAISQEGSTFDFWSGDLNSTDNPVIVTVNGPMQITANFIDPNFYKYTLFKTGQGSVTVSPDLSEFPEGSSAIFTAVPAEGWQFKNWNGSLLGTENPDTLIFDSNENIQVVFELITSVKDSDIPSEFNLEQNYPNPFNPTTIISYSISESAKTKISIINPIGKVVDVLVDEIKERGNYQINYNASNLTSGVYFINFKAGKYSETRKMILNR